MGTNCYDKFQLSGINCISACNVRKIELERVPDLAQWPGPEEKLSYPILPGPKPWQKLSARLDRAQKNILGLGNARRISRAQ